MVNDISIFQTKAKSHNGFIKLSSADAATVYADTLPIPTQDNNGRDGWLFTKTTGTEKFNYYFYGEGSHPITLSQISNVFFTAAADTYTDSTSLPFIVVYTKLQASGNAGSWYHSKIAYSYQPNHQSNIQLGELCLFHSLSTPSNVPNIYRNIALTAQTKTGEALGSEEIYTISIQSDSSSPDNTRILVQDVGFNTLDGRVYRNIKLID